MIVDKRYIYPTNIFKYKYYVFLKMYHEFLLLEPA